ncbi:MAG: hypothetical protein PHX61_02685 [Alphaproteobacteria bacterium]|nr:hypothetical protein [Alphaproteobacteria bacterium]
MTFPTDYSRCWSGRPAPNLNGFSLRWPNRERIFLYAMGALELPAFSVSGTDGHFHHASAVIHMIAG